jgi:aspartoacylase
VGPVPQGVVQAGICRHTQLGLEAALAVLGQARSGRPRLPAALVVHRHLRSLDLPRRPDGSPRACIHPQLQSRDWQTLPPGSPLFFDPDGGVIRFEPGPDQEPQVAVFINEAAYGEKGIALSLTRREEWPVLPEWSEALMACASRLAAAG